MESNRNGNLELCSKPLRFQTKQLKAMKSSGEKEHWTWTASEPFLSIRSVSFLLLPPPPPPQDCFRGHHFPLSLYPFGHPDGKVNGGKAGDAQAQRRNPRHPSLSGPLSGLACPCASLPQGFNPLCCPVCPRASRGVSVAVSDATLGCQPLLPSVSLYPHTPAHSSRSSLPPPLCSIPLTAPSLEQ